MLQSGHILSLHLHRRREKSLLLWWFNFNGSQTSVDLFKRKKKRPDQLIVCVFVGWLNVNQHEWNKVLRLWTIKSLTTCCSSRTQIPPNWIRGQLLVAAFRGDDSVTQLKCFLCSSDLLDFNTRYCMTLQQCLMFGTQMSATVTPEISVTVFLFHRRSASHVTHILWRVNRTCIHSAVSRFLIFQYKYQI